MENKQNDLRSLIYENYEKIQAGIVAIHWSIIKLIKDCIPKFMNDFFSCDILFRIMNLLLCDIFERLIFT